MPHGMNTGTGKRSTYTPLKIDLGITSQPTIGQLRGAQRQAAPAPKPKTGDRYKYTPLDIDLGITSQPTKAQSSTGRGRTTVPKATIPTAPKPATQTEEASVVPERPTQATGGVEVPALGGSTYSVMGVEYDAASGQAINPDTGKTSSGGYSIDPKTSARTDYSRGQTRTNGLNVTQTGTQTSPMAMTFEDVNSILAGHGINNYGFGEKYSSNQLPTTESSPYGAYSSEDAAAFGRSDKDNSVIAGGGSTETVIDGDTDLKNVKTNYLSGDRPKQNRSFLDFADDGKPGASLRALRAKEASNGVFYAEGKHHIANPNAGKEGQNDFRTISKDEAASISSGKQTAQGLRDQYVNALTSKENAEPPLPDSVPNDSPLAKSPFDTSGLMNPNNVRARFGNK